MNWGALLNVVVLAATLRAAIVAFGPAAQRIGDDLQLSGASLGLLGSLPILMFGLVALVVNKPVRVLGFDLAALLALVALALGLATRLLPDAWALWLGTAVIGLSIGILNVLAPAFVKRDFPTRLPLITGIYASAMAATAAISIALVTPLTIAVGGNWRIALTTSLPVVLLAIGMQAARYARERRTAGSSAPVPVDVDKHSSARVWRSPLAWAVTAFMGLQSLMFYSFMTWAPSIEVASGFTEAQANVHLSVGQVLGIFGSLIIAAVMQRVPDHRIVAVGIAVAGMLLFLAMLLWPELFPIWTPLLGFLSTPLLGVALALIGERAGSTHEAATLSGMAQSIGYIIAAIGPVFVGGLFDVTGSWATVLWSFVGVFVLLAAAGFIAGQNRTISPREA
ncbi:MFS transporter [Gulosibacter molinativorax]|uniref:MFS transporter n=2 Tax=Gulosibacter molinativorax TaxID=256821 RepID=A0ABT7C7C4_9MICO|nr:MFS transporter [Gulosibacter molinativorax]